MVSIQVYCYLTFSRPLNVHIYACTDGHGLAVTYITIALFKVEEEMLGRRPPRSIEKKLTVQSECIYIVTIDKKVDLECLQPVSDCRAIVSRQMCT